MVVTINFFAFLKNYNPIIWTNIVTYSPGINKKKFLAAKPYR